MMAGEKLSGSEFKKQLRAGQPKMDYSEFPRPTVAEQTRAQRLRLAACRYPARPHGF